VGGRRGNEAAPPPQMSSWLKRRTEQLFLVRGWGGRDGALI